MKHRSLQRHLQTGLSLVELMVGITIGLIVVAAASLMMTRQVTENSQLLLETQLQQDLRAAAELMLRDIRRAGYDGNADKYVWNPSVTTAAPNIYAPTSPPQVDDDHFYYAYGGSSAGPVPASNESFGFMRDTENCPTAAIGVLYAINGTQFDPSHVPDHFEFADASFKGTWQPLTDCNVVNVTSFKVTLNVQPTALGEQANPPKSCAVGDADCPCLLVRRVHISITGQAVRDSRVNRTIEVDSRIRNDQVVPSCTAPT